MSMFHITAENAAKVKQMMQDFLDSGGDPMDDEEVNAYFAEYLTQTKEEE